MRGIYSLVRVLIVNVRVEILAVVVYRNLLQHFRVALALCQRLFHQRRGVKLEPVPLRSVTYTCSLQPSARMAFPSRWRLFRRQKNFLDF